MALTKAQKAMFEQYGMAVRDITRQQEYPGFDFSIFRGMDEQYDKIRNGYGRIANNPNYTAEYKAEKKQEAMAAIKALKTEYHDKALKWIDKTYRKPKPKKKGPSAFTLTTNDMVLQELQRSRQFAVLREQIKVEPPAKLLELYRENKDDPDAVTLIELELRQRKDAAPGGDTAAIEAWTEIMADLNGGEIVANHWESKIKAVLNVDAHWFPLGLEHGIEAAKYEQIEL